MKGLQIIRMVSGVLAFSLMGSVGATDVTGLTTFVPNTPAKAEEVNGNFNAVKSAVDDNDQRITDLEAKLPDGAVSLSAFAFSEWTSSNSSSSACQELRILNYVYFDMYWAKSTSCSLTAPVHLPQGATVTGLSCLVNDELYGTAADSNFYPITLRQLDLTTATTNGILSTGTSSSDVGLQTLTATPFDPDAPELVVDNTQYAYTLMVTANYADDVAPAVEGNTLKLHGCKVEYTLP
ncbi:hypothetical protein MWU49_12890 [Alcanivorax sp. S6407]|uniref:hypothetical protein n=1 Tax=Alcanivorax sp. S6407 TaxID=2926424 RepID=UPI001FF4C5BA|nr:hypothetical protein [Alcanivorax sp. S6407]MCK0154608.1 hypothetical protein [Alcanivorax sp. S6407]